MPTKAKRSNATLHLALDEFVPIGEENNYLLCLNENTYWACYQLFKFYGRWLSRYVLDKEANVWYQPEQDSTEAAIIGDMYDKGLEELSAVTCMDELVKTQRMLIAAITGDPVDFTQPLPDDEYIPGRALVDIQQMQLAAITGEAIDTDVGLPTAYTPPRNVTILLEGIDVRLEEIRDALGQAESADDIEAILDSINIMLGGAAILAAA